MKTMKLYFGRVTKKMSSEEQRFKVISDTVDYILPGFNKMPEITIDSLGIPYDLTQCSLEELGMFSSSLRSLVSYAEGKRSEISVRKLIIKDTIDQEESFHFNKIREENSQGKKCILGATELKAAAREKVLDNYTRLTILTGQGKLIDARVNSANETIKTISREISNRALQLEYAKLK